MYFTLKVTRLSSLYSKFFCSALLAKGLFKDPTVWLDGARPGNTCIPLLWKCTHTVARQTHPQKYICKYKKLSKFGKINILFKKSEKEFNKCSFCNSEFVKCKIWQGQKFDNLSNKIECKKKV
jgi:hypothetical protein